MINKTATGASVQDKEIFKTLIEGSTQKSYSVDCAMLLPSSLEGETHETWPIFNDAMGLDKDLIQSVIHRCPQEQSHGLSFKIRWTEVILTPVTSIGRDLILLLWRQTCGVTKGDCILAKSRQAFMSTTSIAQSLTSKIEVLTKYGRPSKRRRRLFLEKSSLYLTLSATGNKQ